MNRNQAIDVINAHLSSLDDERVQTIAKIVQSMAAPDDLPRALTARELALIEQSKEDFKAGRVYSVEEARALTDQFLAARGVEPSR